MKFKLIVLSSILLSNITFLSAQKSENYLTTEEKDISINIASMEKRIYTKIKNELEVEILSQMKTFLRSKDYDAMFLINKDKKLKEEQERLFRDVFPKVPMYRILKKLRYFMKNGDFNRSLIRINYLVMNIYKIPEKNKKMYFFEISKFYNSVGQYDMSIKYSNEALNYKMIGINSLKELLPISITDINVKNKYIKDLESEYSNERILFFLLNLYKITGNNTEYEKTKSILEY